MSEVTECDSASEVKGIHNQNQFHNDPYPHSLANTYLLSIYYVPGLMLQPQLYLRNKWMQIASTYTIQRLKGGKLNFKMPSALSHLLVQHPHILQFHFQMQIPSRCRFFPSTFPPSLVMKGREEEKPRQTEAEPFPAGQRQRRAACVPSFQTFDSFVFICAIPGNVTITQIPDPDYCFSSIISPNPHQKLQSTYYLYYCYCLNSYPSFKDEATGKTQLYLLHCHRALNQGIQKLNILSTTGFPKPWSWSCHSRFPFKAQRHIYVSIENYIY